MKPVLILTLMLLSVPVSASATQGYWLHTYIPEVGLRGNWEKAFGTMKECMTVADDRNKLLINANFKYDCRYMIVKDK